MPSFFRTPSPSSGNSKAGIEPGINIKKEPVAREPSR